jgi:hypothetical protein
MAIEEFTNQLKVLKEHGEADLQLSPTIRDQYLAAVRDFRGVLEDQREKIRGLRAYGNAGSYSSATETKNRFLNNVNDMNGISTILDKYITYLDEFEATVKAACKRLHGDDAGSGETVSV